MKALMNHQFFEGINFQTDLTQLDIKKKLDESDYEEPTSPTMEFDIESETGAREFIVQKFGEKKPYEPILEGALMKKNTWNYGQERQFALFANGQIKYFHMNEERGNLILTKDSWARKISRGEVQLRIPGLKKDYILMAKDPKKCAPTTKNYSCNLGDWVEAINAVCKSLAS